MFFVISKLVENFLLPSNAIGLLAIAGVLLIVLRRVRLGAAFLIVSTLAVVLVGWLPVGSASLGILENRFSRPAIQGKVTGIVMLGGAVNTHVSADRSTVALNDAGERLVAVAELSRRYPDARIILSGGISHLLFGRGETESALAKTLLVKIGVAPDRIELEERSRNTCENASYSKVLAAPRPGEQWILVTSANHMPRAVACFRAAGFPVIPYPVDYRTEHSPWQFSKSIADGLQMADLAAHEWIGLWAYHLTKGTELFPAPRAPEQGSP